MTMYLASHRKNTGIEELVELVGLEELEEKEIDLLLLTELN